jgi:hypothetical protein
LFAFPSFLGSSDPNRRKRRRRGEKWSVEEKALFSSHRLSHLSHIHISL